MIPRLAALSLLLLATPVQAQQMSPAERNQFRALGSALAQCHGQIVMRDAPTRLTTAQITERALAGCARREVPIRAAVLRQIGPQRTAQAMLAQRAHWRQGIAQMVARARAAH